MIPTPTRLKYIPILEFGSRVTLKKEKLSTKNPMRQRERVWLHPE
jgi:hypothetical protein